MKASRKKSATISLAVGVIGGALTAFANANYIPAGIMLLIGAGLMTLYEFYNVEQIKGTDPEQVRSASRALGDAIKNAAGNLRSGKSK